MTAPDTITLGSRVLVRTGGHGSVYRSEDDHGDWMLSIEGGKWRAHLLDVARTSSHPCTSPEEAYSDLLSTLADEHETRARALREELGRV